MTEVNGTHLNKITQGDSIEEMRKISDKRVDMILCDLPYGTTACKWDTIIPFDLLWAEYERIIKDNGAIVLTASQPFTSALIMSNPKLFRYEVIWEKEQATNFMFLKKQIGKAHENILVFYKKQPTYNPQMIKTDKPIKSSGGNTSRTFENQTFKGSDNVRFEKYPCSVLKINRDRRPKHPTQKPVALFEYLIRTYTNEGEVVLDNTIGSGTTAVACINTNRNFIGIEREPEYVAIANQRITEARN